MSKIRYLLDTNIVIALFAQEKSVLQKIAKNEVFVPAIVIGELYFGAEKSVKKDQNRIRIDQLCEASTILNCDAQSADNYGIIKEKLRANGTPIPDNDVWIAAIAIQNGFTLVTRDKHFDYINELILEKW